MKLPDPPFEPGVPLTPEDVVRQVDWQGFADIHGFSSAGILWHYTSIEAAVSILKNRTLRASEIRYLNDSNEYRHALSVLGAVIRDEMPPVGDNRRPLAEKLESIAQQVSDKDQLVFVFSASELEDDLSQWRGYCPPAGGIALGFESRRLQMYGKAAGFTLLKCLYTPEDKRAAVSEVVRRALASFGESLSTGSDLPVAWTSAHSAFLESFLPLAARLKDEAFKDEREWRLVTQPMAGYPPLAFPLQVRAGRTTLVPYIDIPFRTDDLTYHPITRVVTGPAPDPELARHAATLLLYQHGMHFDILRVTHSAVPYRTWL